MITERVTHLPFASQLPLRYCPTCKNDTSEVVKAGEKLKASKKKAKMPSATTESQRDWGKVRPRSGTLLPSLWNSTYKPLKNDLSKYFANGINIASVCILPRWRQLELESFSVYTE